MLEGDITEPDLGLDARSMRWVAENCDTMLHNAASLTFQSTSRHSEPWRSNVEGTRHVLDMCRNAGIRRFHHVSTAYVCGLRQGRILESETDVGQKMSNDYEQSKLQAEGGPGLAGPTGAWSLAGKFGAKLGLRALAATNGSRGGRRPPEGTGGSTRKQGLG